MASAFWNWDASRTPCKLTYIPITRPWLAPRHPTTLLCSTSSHLMSDVRSPAFERRRKRTGRHLSSGTLEAPFPYLRTSRFHGYEEERTLPGALGDVFGLVHVTMFSPEVQRDVTNIAANSASTLRCGFENIKQIPSWRKAGSSFVFQRVQKIEDRLRRTSKQIHTKISHTN